MKIKATSSMKIAWTRPSQPVRKSAPDGGSCGGPGAGPFDYRALLTPGKPAALAKRLKKTDGKDLIQNDL